MVFLCKFEHSILIRWDASSFAHWDNALYQYSLSEKQPNFILIFLISASVMVKLVADEYSNQPTNTFRVKCKNWIWIWSFNLLCPKELAKWKHNSGKPGIPGYWIPYYLTFLVILQTNNLWEKKLCYDLSNA